MLHAFNKHKISHEIRKQIWNIEDIKTSSIIGNLLHLPTAVFWNIIRNASDKNDALGKKLPTLSSDEDIIDYEFWPYWILQDKVEPDVFIRFTNFDLIIELKVHDYNQQKSWQWKREFDAYRKRYNCDDKPVYLIAISGKTEASMENVYQCSWQSLLESVLDIKEISENEYGHVSRIFNDILVAFSVHQEYYFKYFDSIPLEHTNISSDYNLFPILI